MKKLFLKLIVYSVLVLLCLELLVRVFHLHNERPLRFTDTDKINKWVPGQEEYAVYGNRRQNFSQYKINESGFNSYREFSPTEQGMEIALLGDSYIEGFHQDYFSSVGKQIEERLGDVEVYEYGHSSNDLADEFYLMSAHKETFDLIDHVIIYMKYKNDLGRPEFELIQRPLTYASLRRSKLFVYALDIGLMDPIKKLPGRINALRNFGNIKSTGNDTPKIDKDSLYLENFKHLVKGYGFDKQKVAILLDGRVTNQAFLDYLDSEGFDVIDYAKTFEEATNGPTDLIYDKHWNAYGRELIAKDIADYIANKKPNEKTLDE